MSAKTELKKIMDLPNFKIVGEKCFLDLRCAVVIELKELRQAVSPANLMTAAISRAEKELAEEVCDLKKQIREMRGL